MASDVQIARRFRIVNCGDELPAPARIRHAFMSDGMVRRFVHIRDPSWRDVLDKPRETEIDPLDTMSDDLCHLSHRDIWEMAERTATAMLTELRVKVEEALEVRAQQLSLQAQRESERQLGKQLVPLATRESVSGTLVHAGERPGIIFCIEVLSDSGEVHRIEGLDLPRALEASGVQNGEVINVSTVATHNVEIETTHTGSHGDGATRHRHSRTVFNIEGSSNEHPIARRQHRAAARTEDQPAR